MSDWVDRFHDKYVERKADEEIGAQRYRVAVQEACRLANLLKERVCHDVAKFQAKFPDRIEGPMNGDDDFASGTKFRTSYFPLSILEFKLSSDRIDFKRRYKRTQDAPWAEENGSILVKADFDTESWFEHQGNKLLTVEEVSQLLLSPIFDYALPR